MALGGLAEDGNDWESGSHDVPVLRSAGRFDEPTISKELVSYVRSTGLADDGAYIGGNTGALSK
jgi:hypothetical protein